VQGEGSKKVTDQPPAITGGTSKGGMMTYKVFRPVETTIDCPDCREHPTWAADGSPTYCPLCKGWGTLVVTIADPAEVAEYFANVEPARFEVPASVEA
jgi:hypothetical protein